MSAEEIVPAVRRGDLAQLVRIPGVGKKTAERIVLELRDKLAPTDGSEPVRATPRTELESDVLSALLNLGYERRDAERALEGLARGGAAGGFESVLRAALSRLSPPARQAARFQD